MIFSPKNIKILFFIEIYLRTLKELVLNIFNKNFFTSNSCFIGILMYVTAFQTDT